MGYTGADLNIPALSSHLTVGDVFLSFLERFRGNLCLKYNHPTLIQAKTSIIFRLAGQGMMSPWS